MAKKRFNISSTLNKNKGNQAELAAKVPLRKTPKKEEDIKEKVEEIHENSSPTPPIKTVPVKKAIVKSQRKVSVKKIEEEGSAKLVRLTIDTPIDTHKRLKIQAIEEGMSMRDYILRLLERNLK